MSTTPPTALPAAKPTMLRSSVRKFPFFVGVVDAEEALWVAVARAPVDDAEGGSGVQGGLKDADDVVEAKGIADGLTRVELPFTIQTPSFFSQELFPISGSPQQKLPSKHWVNATSLRASPYEGKKNVNQSKQPQRRIV